MVPLPDPRLGTEIREAFAEPNWAQWVKLNLEMTKSDGSLLKMEMLRHEDWVLENIDYQFLDEEDLKATSLLRAANSSQFLKSLPLEAPPVPLRTLFAELQDMRLLLAEVEADSILVTISLDLPEIGVRGEAVVTGVAPCPVILAGPGKVVLTTFHHASSHLIDLYLSPQPPTGVNSPTTTYLTSTSNSPAHQLNTLQTSEEALLYPKASRSSNIDLSWERIGVTGNHPIWSDDRHDYVAAMDLRVGERLKNLSGDTVYVQQKLPRPGPTPVYNLEVQDEHVYYVGASEVLAHNAGDEYRPDIRKNDLTTLQDFKDRSVVGDNIEGHELLQHAWLKENGHATSRLSTDISKGNPVIGLKRPTHQVVNALQSQIDFASQSAVENILANRRLMLDQGFSRRRINRFTRKALRHAKENNL